MAEHPYMPLYVADYLADTGHLRAVEHGAYLMLLMHLWRVGCLPNNDAQLARIARVSTREWASIRETIAAFFGPDWTHQRVEKERAKARSKSLTNAANGARGGAAKSLKNKDAGVANATNSPEQPASEKLPYQYQSQIKEEDSPLKPPLDALPLGLPPHPSDEGLKAAVGRKGGASRGSRLPSGWTLSAEGRAYATAKGLSNGRIEREAERFRDFWLAKPGKDGVKADWEATWRNWVLKVVDRGDLTLGQTAPAAPVARYYDN